MSDFTIIKRRERAYVMANNKKAEDWIKNNIVGPSAREAYIVSADLIEDTIESLTAEEFTVDTI